MNDIYDDVESMFTVMDRAARVLGSIEDEVPYFLKCMLPSNVTYSFWLVSLIIFPVLSDSESGKLNVNFFVFPLCAFFPLFSSSSSQIIPRKFGTLHLPSQDSTVILVDEWGKEYKTTYLIDRNGLSAGWRGFSISHRLLKGDILIFRLIGPCKLQVIV